MTAWLAAYGMKKVSLKPFLTVMETFAASTVPATKNEALNFYREVFRWLGDGPNMQAIIKNLKKQQIVSSTTFSSDYRMISRRTSKT